eukprot:20107_6
METGAKASGGSLLRGMPDVKAGKSRQHGGYGIGSKNNKNGGRDRRGSDFFFFSFSFSRFNIGEHDCEDRKECAHTHINTHA